MDRDLIIRVLRWARSDGWTQIHGVWRSEDRAVSAGVDVVGGDVLVSLYQSRPSDAGIPSTSQVWVADERQAVDVLCALGILPPWFSSQWRDGFSCALAGKEPLGVPEHWTTISPDWATGSFAITGEQTDDGMAYSRVPDEEVGVPTKPHYGYSPTGREAS